MYEYKALVTAVYDADTITADIDLGFKTSANGVKLRLYGINAPEVRLGRGTTPDEKKKGLAARDWLRERILEKEVMIRTYQDKSGKFGRWLVEVFPKDDLAWSYNELLVEHGHAELADYG